MSNSNAQWHENTRVERLAKREAKACQLGVYYRPVWIEDGRDASEPMLAWPDGYVEPMVDFLNRQSADCASRNWAAGCPDANRAEYAEDMRRDEQGERGEVPWIAAVYEGDDLDNLPF